MAVSAWVRVVLCVRAGTCEFLPLPATGIKGKSIGRERFREVHYFSPYEERDGEQTGF